MDPYLKTIDELYHLQKFAIKLGLDNITELTRYLNDPHTKYPTIHIAGTNGKGSTAFYIAEYLQNCGLKTGLYTSPHLIDYRERIRINGDYIEEDYIINIWNEIKKTVYSLKATFFDTSTAIAFNYFSENKVDVAVIETGLGGRLDSTNIIKPDIAVITPINFDHQKHLGNTIKKIANEKAGILKNDSEIFVAKQVKSVLNILQSKYTNSSNFNYLPDLCKIQIKNIGLNGLNFEIYDLLLQQKFDLFSSSPAEYQAGNIATAFFASRHFCIKNKISYSEKNIISATKTASWPGRMQLFQKNPHIFFDVSHNLAGIKTTIHSFEKIINLKKTTLLLGFVNDKDTESIVNFLAGRFKKVVVTEPDTNRKQDGEYLLKLFQSKRQKVKFVKDLNVAYEFSLKNIKSNEVLIVLGSHYLVGALLKNLK